VGLGILLCFLLKRWEFIQLPDIYYDRTLPVVLEAGMVAGIALCATVIVLAACFYPSRRASKVDPLEGIRFG
jgi:lipoprotein-releasing system permease protein